MQYISKNAMNLLILSKNGVIILLDIYANAGGETVSYFEWVQVQLLVEFCNLGLYTSFLTINSVL